ncbi:hypothetical protein [Hyalangium sp.]|uniref:hypothetical protein n=1 Tax=Hyalangium sp. TaxID=2028555 RepID=UPI002D6FF9E6|nr:hypothetical protein [Hyalangium sp.]HYH98308.1 hypothetical protein [Hyalangium sp.]
MRYRVRTPEGELDFESILHVEQAYIAGLVDPEDELLEEGGTLWRKAASIPSLARARRPNTPGTFGRAQGLTILAAVVLGVISFALLTRGSLVLGLVLAMVVVSVLTRVTYKAFRRPAPR